MSRSSEVPIRKALPLLAVLFFGAIWSAYWYTLSVIIEDRYSQARARLAAEGTNFDCAQSSWGGFPFRITLTCTLPRLELAGDRPVKSVAAQHLTVLMQAYDYRHFILLLDGPTDIAGTALGPLVLTHDQLTANLMIPSRETARMAIEVLNFGANGTISAEAGLLSVTINEGGHLHADATVSGLRINVPHPIGADRLAAEIAIPPAIAMSSAPLRAAASTGALIEVSQLEVQRGDLLLHAAGRLGLAPDGRVKGEGITRINDLKQLLSAAREALKMTEAETRTMETLLQLLSAGKKELSIPLRAEKGTIYWGPFRLGEMSAFTG